MNELSKLTLLDETEVYLRDDAALHEVSKEIEGNPIAFSDGTDTPLVNCRVSVSSRQDLHGYDKPWVGGAGNNKLPMTVDGLKAINTDGSWSGNSYILNGVTFTIETDGNDNVLGITTTGTATAITYFVLDSNFNSTAYSGYIISGLPTSGSAQTYLMRITSQSSFVAIQDILLNSTVIEDNGNGLRLSIRISDSYTISASIIFHPMLRASGTSDTFQPYSNICPISGYDEVEIEGCGKNLCPIDSNSFSGSATWVSLNNVNANTITNGTELDLKGGQYTLSFSDFTGVTTKQIAREDTTFVVNTDSNSVSFTLNSDEKLYFRIKVGSGTSASFKVQIEKGSTATSWEPYTPNSYTISLGSTRYGGELDVSRGVLRVTKIKLSKKWSEGTSETVLGDYTRKVFILPSNAVPNDENAICNVAPRILNYTSDMLHFYVATETALVFLPNGTDGDTDIEIVYTLSTPLTISLTPTQVRSLLGSNYMSCNSGDLSVEYITEDYQPLLETTKKQIYEELPFTIKNGKLHVIYNK